VQLPLRGRVVAGGEVGPGQQAAVEGAVDQFLLFASRGFEDVVDDFGALAGVTDSQP